jgi:hypothetical protein
MTTFSSHRDTFGETKMLSFKSFRRLYIRWYFLCRLVIVYRVLPFCKQGNCIKTGMNIGLKFRILKNT